MLLVVLHATAAERLSLQFDAGGRGLLAATTVILCGVGCVLAVRSALRGRLPFLHARPTLVWCAYWCVLGVLPLLGILFLDFPIHILAAILPALVALSITSLSANWPEGERAQKVLRRYLALAIAAQVSMAALQFMGRTGMVSLPFLSTISNWDAETIERYGYEALSRSSGFFVNPNALGFWAALSVWVSLFLFERGSRWLLFAAACTALVLSQSRGAMLACIGGAVPLVIAAATSGRLSKRLTAFLGAGLTALVVATASLAVHPGLIEDTFLQRLGSAANVLSGGISEDGNLKGRTEFWAIAWRTFRDHPAGTWGPPQLVAGVPMDNDWVAHLVQGGLPLVVLLLIALSISVLRVRAQPLLAVLAAVVMVAMLSQPSSTYSAMALYWLVLGRAFRRPPPEVVSTVSV